MAAAGAETFGVVGIEQAAPLEVVAQNFGIPGAGFVVAVGAVTAMLGVLLNILLGLSRVVLAMGRRGDLPKLFAKLDASGVTPSSAVIFVAIVISFIVLIGDIKATWSFSAFTVLVYYSLTNLCAMRLSESERLYPRFIPWTGLIACLFLAFWVEPLIWMTGLGMIGVGLIWHRTAILLSSRAEPPAAS